MESFRILQLAHERSQDLPTAMNTVNALITPASATAAEQRPTAREFAGYVFQRSRGWPHSWQRRWCVVRLGAFGHVSRVSGRRAEENNRAPQAPRGAKRLTALPAKRAG